MALLGLLFLVLAAGSSAERNTSLPEPSSVPVPTNLIIKSYNLNPVLHWRFQNTSATPVFTVQVKTYESAVWKDACNNISHHHCNIFYQVDDPSYPLWARVKARIGQEESAFVESNEFILCEQGKIGPPTLNVTRIEDKILTNIIHPLVVHNGEVKGPICDEDDTCYSFDYYMYIRVNGSKSTDKKPVGDVCDCDECRLSIPVSSLNSEYCISIEGVSTRWQVTTERSKEVCVTITNNSVKDVIWIPVVAAVLLFVVLILVCVCCHIKKINPFKRKNITLPKSLISVVKNASGETKPESKNVSLITSSQPLIPEGEKVICEEQLSPDEDPGTHKAESLAPAEHTEELSGVTVITEEIASDMVPARPLTPTQRKSSFHSSSNLSEICSTTSNSCPSQNGSDSGVVESESLFNSEFSPNDATETKPQAQEAPLLRNTPSSFGYDKPHVMVDLLVGEDPKESLIGYRLTTDSKEFS